MTDFYLARYYPLEGASIADLKRRSRVLRKLLGEGAVREISVVGYENRLICIERQIRKLKAAHQWWQVSEFLPSVIP